MTRYVITWRPPADEETCTVEVLCQHVVVGVEHWKAFSPSGHVVAQATTRPYWDDANVKVQALPA